MYTHEPHARYIRFAGYVSLIGTVCTNCILAQTAVGFQCVNDVQLLLWWDVWNRFVLKCELIIKG